jgi:hypothetical protein
MENFRVRLVGGGDPELLLYRDENGRAKSRDGWTFVGRTRGWRLSAVSPAVYSNIPKEKLKELRSKGEAILSEEEGIRLALVMRGVKRLSDVSRAAMYASGIYEMSREESFYWFALTSNEVARRGVRALRVLLGGVK